MCGIAGFVMAGGASTPPSVLRNMCDRISHRGPDDFGEFRQGSAALGHRRLSIIDLSGGHQPIANEDGSLQVVFNGEIYNYLELRQELLARGHRLETRSDTEVLVHLYEELGERMTERLNGMFAFAIWDARRQELFLGRDRLGKKPLYYTLSAPGMRIAFSSELKALLAIPRFQPTLNPQSVADFLAYSYVPDPATIYKEVFKLEPGRSLLLTANGPRIRRYWAPNFTESALSLDTGIEEIQSLAADAVKRRLLSEVPLGAFLSGGVDSSAVTGFMARTASEVKTFSIGFADENGVPDPRFDESGYAALAARHNRTNHHAETVTPSVHDVLDQLTWFFDEPFGDSSAIPMLYLSRMTRQHVTVALSGDGADELFAGYRRYRFGVIEQRLRDLFPQAFRRTVIRAAGQWYPKFDYLPQMFRAKTLLTNLAREAGDAYFTSMTAFRDESLTEILAPELRHSLRGYSPRDAYRGRFEAVRHLGPLEQMQSVDLDTYLPGDILVKADRATMAHSLESRSPWLDYRMAELACRIPAALKIQGQIGKFIFKKAMEPYVPLELIYRNKMGFSVPLASWFRTSLKPVFEKMVLSDGAAGLVSPEAARRLWNEHQSGFSNHDKKLWNLLILGLWHNRFHGAFTSDRQELASALP